MGKNNQKAHDDRYDVADEYMEVVYKLWEGSWQDDAVLRDRVSGIFTDPSKVESGDVGLSVREALTASVSGEVRGLTGSVGTDRSRPPSSLRLID